MFTGLIRHQGYLRTRAGCRLEINCPVLAPALAAGASVAVNGVCLTVAALDRQGFGAELLAETLGTTTLGRLPIGTQLNLEPALAAGDAMGGHIVQGHIDGTVQLLARAGRDDSTWGLEFELPGWLEPLIIERGSVAVDGVSLTVQEMRDRSFSIAVIPTTWRETNLKQLTPGTMVNIEADIIVKTVHRTVQSILTRTPGITAGDLRKLGYGG